MKARKLSPFEIQIHNWRKGQEKIQERAKKFLPIKAHGFYIYECDKCGAIYKMHLQKGLCEKLPEIKAMEEEGKELVKKANAIPGVEMQVTIPIPEPAMIGVPEAFICPHCADSAEEEEDLGHARHIFRGSNYEVMTEYEATDKDNIFIESKILNQGIPCIFAGVDFASRNDFLAYFVKHEYKSGSINPSDILKRAIDTEKEEE